MNALHSTPLLAAALLAGCSSPPITALSCGDGRVDSPEACDEGEANGTPGHCFSDCSGVSTLVSVEGDVLAFLSEVEGERIAGATITILEQPEKTFVTGDDAHFRFDDLEVGAELTLLVEHPDFKTTQTATHRIGENGIAAFAVQIVPTTIFEALSNLVPLPVDEDQYCIIATTVARMGGSLYVYLRQGAPEAAVTLDPPPPEESGPIYFNENVLPDPEAPATSIDGGVLFYRVPPGDYTMTATKPGNVFNELHLQCRPNVIVNAGPPLGLLQNVPAPDHGQGQDRAPDTYSESTDALCEKTAECVNMEAGATTYPAMGVESCKAMFQDTWAFVDESCDADSTLRESAKALYTCRTTDCATTLGGDDVCTTEEAAFTAAQATYGACLAAR